LKHQDSEEDSGIYSNGFLKRIIPENIPVDRRGFLTESEGINNNER